MNLTESMDTNLKKVVNSTINGRITKNNTGLPEEKLNELRLLFKKEIYSDIKSKLETTLPKPKERKGLNLFLCPTVIGIAYSLWISIAPGLEEAIRTKQFTTYFWFDTFSKLFAAVATLSLRGSEGNKGVFTPRGFPGLDREEIDNNNNGIPDYLEA